MKISATDLDEKTFERIKKLVGGKCGINLTGNKLPLVAARLMKRMSALGVAEASEYIDFVENDSTGVEAVMLLDAISTNVTSFFREPAHFDFLKKEVEQMARSGQKRFRFWSAGCSSGEEPYTMAFIIKDALAGRNADVKILASDISTKVLGAAHQGMYEEKKIPVIEGNYKGRYFSKVKKGLYTVAPEIREMVLLKRINLTEMPFPLSGGIDFIFCRNVMIYFDREFREKLVAEFYRLLKPGGFLIVSHTESLIGLNRDFERTGPSIYKK